MKQSPAEKQIDKRIEAAFYAKCGNVQIPMMRIPDVFAEGRKAISEGRDLEDALVSFVSTIAVG